MYPDLVQVLARELLRPTRRGPRIIEEKVRGINRIHVTVIWPKWRDIDPADRSSTILDAYEQARGPEGMLSVSVAMGLTPEEADRLGIK
jgi:hypothetical protein